MSNVDWSKAPEGFPLWLEYLQKALEDDFDGARAATGGCWVKEESDRYWTAHGTYWSKPTGGFYKIHKRPAAPQWNGEGLPPVGAVVEAFYMGIPQGVVTVRYAGQCMILWSGERNSEQCGAAEHYIFRPIRTPEQLSAEAREKAIIEIMRDAGITGSALKDDPEALEWASSLWANGYRKQDQPE